MEFPRKKEDELAEARGHLTYFQRLASGLSFAMAQMQTDEKLCQKSIRIWEGRIEKLEARQKGHNRPVDDGKSSEILSPKKEADPIKAGCRVKRGRGNR
jgi:hypothetical protein